MAESFFFHEKYILLKLILHLRIIQLQMPVKAPQGWGLRWGLLSYDLTCIEPYFKQFGGFLWNLNNYFTFWSLTVGLIRPQLFEIYVLFLVFWPHLSMMKKHFKKIILSRFGFRFSPKSNLFVFVTDPTCPPNFVRIRPQLFEIFCSLINKQTDRQTDKLEITHRATLGETEWIEHCCGISSTVRAG